MTLRQALTIKWIKRSVSRWDTDSMKGSIAVYCDVRGGPQTVVNVRGTVNAPLSMHSMKAQLEGEPGRSITPVANESGTLRALQGAYGATTRLSQLGLNMMIAIRAMGATVVWTRRGGTWTPAYRLDDVNGELKEDIFRYARQQADSLTVKDLLPAPDARAWW